MNNEKKALLTVAGLILLIILIYGIFGRQGPSPVVLTKTRLRDLETAVIDWAAKNGGPPQKLSDLGLSRDSTSDHKGTPFLYEVDGETVTISSLGADGKPGGNMFRADHSVSFDCKAAKPAN